MADGCYASSAFRFSRRREAAVQEMRTMFGLGDLSTVFAMLGSVAVTLVCIVYGIVMWNRDDNGGEAKK
jgi:hypothetical protein